MISSICNEVFHHCVKDYHEHNNVDAALQNPHEAGSLQHLFYRKNFIDTVQWHLEDIVRDPNIDPVAGLELKRRIDRSNQERTDLVEQIDDHFIVKYKDIIPHDDATLNTESPAWAIDRLSILVLKIWHMREEAERVDASDEHREKCTDKLVILLDQQKDLSRSIDELLHDIMAGKKKIKVYRQMKMYNDPALNPVLYNQKA
ncbi:MAG: hypothetical protein RJB03_1283 [Bacteroidota bacterium]|jgi:hypothetical protein